VDLVDGEHVVARGAARTTWFVRQGEGWVRAADWAGAEVERRSSGPGTVWERAIRLSLPAGTELLRVETRPLPPPPRDPLSYLQSEIRTTPRATRRTVFRVLRGGRLARTDASPR
jgi:hypothetical protein